jgi:hypothetical protein
LVSPILSLNRKTSKQNQNAFQEHASGCHYTLKMAEDEYKKRDPEAEASIYNTAHTLKMAEDEF